MTQESENTEDKLYTLEELISILEEMRDGKVYAINVPKAFYCVALEIKKLKEEKKAKQQT